jgi:uncharacterized protein YegL
MKKGLVEMIFILDRSGSMRGLEADTIGGFNSLIEKQKQQPGEAIVSTVLFDDQFEVIHHRRDLKTIEALTIQQYYVRGSTALIDAIGRGIKKILHVHQQLGKDNVPEKTIFVITTDGQENASREWTGPLLKKLVSEVSEKYGWEFLFLGANIDAFATAEGLGIRKERAANYMHDGVGTSKNFEAMNEAIFSLRTKQAIDDRWADAVNEDAKKRKK